MPLPIVPLAMVALGFFVLRRLGTVGLLKEEDERIKREAEARRRDHERMQEERRRRNG